MEIDDHDFTLVRKNLNILSVLILILAFTNAQLHKINLLGIEMDLDAIKLYQALFIGYLYFIWRFLTKLPLRSGFWNDFEEYYINSEDGVKKQHNFKVYRDQLIESNQKLKSHKELADGNLNLIHYSLIRNSSSQLRKLRISTRLEVVENEANREVVDTYYDIRLSRIYFMRKLISFCLKYDKFGDYLFPLIPVIAVVFCFIFKSEWQGSFAGLFLR